MFHGKFKAVTFSYDDGVSQDVRLIALLDKYGLKATFNLNSERARPSPTTFCRQRNRKSFIPAMRSPFIR